MKCWDATEAALPWSTRVIYTLWGDTEVATDPNGANMEMVDTTQTCFETDQNVSLRVVSKKINMHVITKNYAGVRIEKRKSFTFRSSFTWVYEFVVSYREPYTSPEEDDDPMLCFSDKPFFNLYITCTGRNDASKGPDYLATSLKAKLTDLR